VVFSLVIISLLPNAIAQLTIGEPAFHKNLEITINENGDVHVVHLVAKNAKITTLNVIDGTVLNLNVTNQNGDKIEYGEVGLGQLTGITIFPTKNDVIVEYDLEDVLIHEGEIWMWDYSYPATTSVFVPSKLDLVYVNNNPILLDDKKGINCHGCFMTLEYIFDEPITTYPVSWEDKEFIVTLRTLAEIESFTFTQESKSLSFDVGDENHFVSAIIPLELLWNPYEVYLDDKKILKHEFFTDETHAWINIKPKTSGTVLIVGTSVVPEFPIFAPLVLGISMAVLFRFRNKINLH